MKYIYRKLLLLLAIITFLIVAPAVALYSMGYRLSLFKESAPAVGVLLVQTIPDSVNLDVNDRHIGRTPRAVPNLSPGSVKVKLSETGYVDWQKNLPIHGAMATDLTGVRLFPSNPSSTILATGIQGFTLSPNRNLLAILERDRYIRILDYKGEMIIPAKIIKGSPLKTLWSTDSSMIAFQYVDSTIGILDVSRPERSVQVVSDFTQVDEIAWDPRVPGRLLVLTTNNQIYAYTTANQESKLLASNVKVFTPGGRHIYVVDNNDKLRILGLDGSLVRVLPTELSNEVRKILVTPNEDVVIHYMNGEVALLNIDYTLTTITGGAIDIGWSLDGKMIYLQSAINEISVYNVSNRRMMYVPLNKVQLVTRLSRPITHPQWFAGGHHLIYQADDEVFITEIDTRDYAISYLADTTGLDDAMAAVGREGEVIYFMKKLEDESVALVEMSLVAE